MLTRRDLLRFSGVAALERSAFAAESPFDIYFLAILEGYLRNCLRTSASFAVCDFPDGTILAASVGRSGKTYDSVSRMLPAMAAWVAGGREPRQLTIQGRSIDLVDVLAAAFRNAFDPANPDYWLVPPPDRQNQRQVEASIVAWALWLSADHVLPRLSPQERRNVQNWLDACARHPVRTNNWAWFTAVNHAARIALSSKWKEFSGDPAFMVEDLKVLDAMAAPGDDGWYSDSLKQEVYDYYNFWVFASHFLYWNRIIGAKYPEWSDRFGERLRAFLKTTPYFFGGNGSHALFGRSLIYRWAVLTPLVLAYQQKLWPHDPGLLRAICRRNIEFFWSAGAFDRERGKLRESFTPEGTHEIRESYVDNGHPYWGMQAFALYMIPSSDPFWTAPEPKLPAESRSFAIRFDGTKMWLRGDANTGDVRWLHAIVGHNEPQYRDKYSKFSYSTRFPWNIVKEKSRCAWDGALIFRDPNTGEMAGQAGVVSGKLTADGYEREWWAMLSGARIRVLSTIALTGAYEYRKHEVEAPERTEILEGSYALGLRAGDRFDPAASPIGLFVRAAAGAVASYGLEGWNRAAAQEESGVNIVFPRSIVVTLSAAARPGVTGLRAAHYASTKPGDAAAIRAEALKHAGIAGSSEFPAVRPASS
jgi:hypothetical protein